MPPMKIQLILYASLAHLLPEESSGNSCFVEMAPGTTIRSLFERFQVPLDSPKIIFLNGRHAMEDHLLHNGDRIAVFPPIAGG